MNNGPSGADPDALCTVSAGRDSQAAIHPLHRVTHALAGTAPDSAIARSSAVAPHRRSAGFVSLPETTSEHGAPPAEARSPRPQAGATRNALLSRVANLVRHAANASGASPYPDALSRYAPATDGTSPVPPGSDVWKNSDVWLAASITQALPPFASSSSSESRA